MRTCNRAYNAKFEFVTVSVHSVVYSE